MFALGKVGDTLNIVGLGETAKIILKVLPLCFQSFQAEFQPHGRIIIFSSHRRKKYLTLPIKNGFVSWGRMSSLISQPQDLPHRALRWVSDYQREIVLALVLGLAFFGGIAGWLSWQGRMEKKAQGALYESQNKKEGLEKVVKDFSGTQAGLLALIALGGNARDAADFDGCIRLFQQAYSKAGAETYFKILALQEVGTCYRAKADYKKAAEFFDRAAKEPGNKAPLA